MHRLLPTLRQLLRATEPTALIVLERLMKARPDLDKLVRWVPSDGTLVPVCSREVAARIVSILLGKVRCLPPTRFPPLAPDHHS